MPKNQYLCDCDVIHQEAVAQIRAAMPEEAVLAAVSDFYKIMGDPTRCKLIFALLQKEMCVCDLANLLSMTKSAVSHQLSKLRGCGVAKCRREGKTIFYSLDDGHVEQVFRITMTHILHHREEEKYEE